MAVVALQTQAAQDIRILRIGIYGHAGIVPGNHVGPEGISHHIGGLQDRIGIDNDHIDVAAAILVDAGKGILIVDGVSGASTGEAPETLLAILVIAAGDAPEGIPILGRVVQAVGLAIDLNGVEVVVFVSHVADIANVGAYHNAALVVRTSSASSSLASTVTFMAKRAEKSWVVVYSLPSTV